MVQQQGLEQQILTLRIIGGFYLFKPLGLRGLRGYMEETSRLQRIEESFISSIYKSSDQSRL